jgi:hypothetical protein
MMRKTKPDEESGTPVIASTPPTRLANTIFTLQGIASRDFFHINLFDVAIPRVKNSYRMRDINKVSTYKANPS